MIGPDSNREAVGAGDRGIAPPALEGMARPDGE